MSAAFTYQRDVTAPHGARPVLPSGGEVIARRDEMRGHVFALQDAMLARPDLHIRIEPTHYFAHGLYGRAVTLPAGSTAVGHAHAQEHICIISKGRAQVVSEDGVSEITAPATLIIPAGRKNCVHALEETVWTTVHASEAKSPEEAEDTLILPEAEARKCLS
jgi:quercetin dioxygenase-like cupin family protein